MYSYEQLRASLDIWLFCSTTWPLLVYYGSKHIFVECLTTFSCHTMLRHWQSHNTTTQLLMWKFVKHGENYINTISIWQYLFIFRKPCSTIIFHRGNLYLAVEKILNNCNMHLIGACTFISLTFPKFGALAFVHDGIEWTLWNGGSVYLRQN